MKKMLIKFLGYVLLILLVGIGSWWAGFQFKALESKREQNVSVVMEKMEKVFKFVAVEGQVSEIFDHKEYYAFKLPMFTKKALIRVHAKVAVGYDFDKVSFNADSERGIITISNFPNPEVLSVDHNLDYYDLSQGSFNKFTEKDYNELNKAAKEHVLNTALEENLLAEAEAQKEELIELLRGLLLTMGYELVVEEAASLEEMQG